MNNTTPTTTPTPTSKHRTGRRIRSPHRPVNSGNKPAAVSIPAASVSAVPNKNKAIAKTTAEVR